MEAKELMIGDWVSMRLPNGKYMADDQLMSVDAVKEGRLIVEPILLTEEILKANGWELIGNYDRDSFYAKDGVFNLNLSNNVFRLFVSCNVIVIRYIHQLQHALRLCGLNEFADNFKLE